MHQPSTYNGNDFYCDEVLSGRTSVRTVLETANVLAFHHTRPSYPVHVVVIPKTHIGSFLELDLGDGALVAELMEAVQRVARQVMADTGSCRVVTNIGSYQDSRHLHWHVISGKYGEPSAAISPEC
jgi:histidine triad (HIT) family protein